MDTYLVKPGESFTISRRQSFYSAGSMISLKATNLSYPEKGPGKIYSFEISYINSDGITASFHLHLESPYYMAIGTFRPEPGMGPAVAGPFNSVKVKSKNAIPIVLQVSFSDRLAAVQ